MPKTISSILAKTAGKLVAGAWARLEGQVRALAFSSEGAHELAFGSGEAAGILNLPPKDEELKDSLDREPGGMTHKGNITSVTFSSDDKTIASGADDGSVYTWTATMPSTLGLRILKSFYGLGNELTVQVQETGKLNPSSASIDPVLSLMFDKDGNLDVLTQKMPKWSRQFIKKPQPTLTLIHHSTKMEGYLEQGTWKNGYLERACDSLRPNHSMLKELRNPLPVPKELGLQPTSACKADQDGENILLDNPDSSGRKPANTVQIHKTDAKPK